jgi:hypothetical protein
MCFILLYNSLGTFFLFRSEKYLASYARVSLETRAESRVGFLVNCPLFFVDLNRNWSDSTILVKLSDISFHKNQFSSSRVLTCGHRNE